MARPTFLLIGVMALFAAMLHPLFSRRFLASKGQGNVNIASGESGSSEAHEAHRQSAPGSISFSYTGQPQQFIVPADVHQLNIVVAGACGGPGNNGYPAAKGGINGGILPVSPGKTLWVMVGGVGSRPNGGWNGGGNTDHTFSSYLASGGGGATDVRSDASIGSRLIVAGGGGGAPWSGGSGGAGGGGNGGNGCDGKGAPGGGSPASSQFKAGAPGYGASCGNGDGVWCVGGGGGFVGGSAYPNSPFGGCPAGGGGSGYVGGVQQGKFVGYNTCGEVGGYASVGHITGGNGYAVISW